MAQRREKRSEWASNRLYEMIVYEKQYEPGSKLPNENEMSAALEVSRTTLREAVSFLVAQEPLFLRICRRTPWISAPFRICAPRSG